MASAVAEVVFSLYCLLITPYGADDVMIWQKQSCSLVYFSEYSVEAFAYPCLALSMYTTYA